MSRFMSVCFALSLLLLCAGCGDSVSTSSNPNQTFVTDVALGGMTEVKLGEIAQKNGASKAVKDFGARMVADHGSANTKLADLASKKGWTMPAALDSKHQKDVDRFSALSGVDFDKKYIDDMVDDHEKDVKDVKEALSKITDPDLKNWAQSALETMESHLQAIKAMKNS
jgi:putative membrane protein